MAPRDDLSLCQKAFNPGFCQSGPKLVEKQDAGQSTRSAARLRKTIRRVRDEKTCRTDSCQYASGVSRDKRTRLRAPFLAFSATLRKADAGLVNLILRLVQINPLLWRQKPTWAFAGVPILRESGNRHHTMFSIISKSSSVALNFLRSLLMWLSMVRSST